MPDATAWFTGQSSARSTRPSKRGPRAAGSPPEASGPSVDELSVLTHWASAASRAGLPRVAAKAPIRSSAQSSPEPGLERRTNRVEARAGSALIARPSSGPLISGIRRSTRTRS